MHTFRLSFATAFRRAFDSPEEERILDLPGSPAPAVLSSGDLALLEESASFVITCPGFANEAEALSHGKALRNALRVAMAELGIGVNLGPKPGTLRFSSEVIDSIAKLGGQVMPGGLGLTAYPDDLNPVFFSTSASGFVLHDIDDVLSRIRRRFGKVAFGSPELELAFDLFGLSSFESSSRAQFLVLVTAIEVMARVEPRPARSLAHLESLIAATKANPDLGTDQARLLAALNNLRSESIASACGRFVAEHGAEGDLATWERLYAIRHKLSHAGHAPTEMASLAGELRPLVQTVLFCAAGVDTAEA